MLNDAIEMVGRLIMAITSSFLRMLRPARTCILYMRGLCLVRLYTPCLFAGLTLVLLSAVNSYAEPGAPPIPPPRMDFPRVEAVEPKDLDSAKSGFTEWVYHKSADGLHPDGPEQQQVWLMNRARANPAAEGGWLATTPHADIAFARGWFGVDTNLLQQEFLGYTPKPPAAFDRRLWAAAAVHSRDLIARDAQDHINQYSRIDDAGFSSWSYRGNVYSYADSGIHAHAAFNIDWGFEPDGMQSGRGHRMAIMSVDGAYTNVGIAVVGETDPVTDVGPYVVTGNFAYAAEGEDDHFNTFIIGTVWEDGNGNGLYDVGEGLAGVTVQADNNSFYAVTGTAGGYAFPAGDGSYDVRFSGTLLASTVIKPVTVFGASVLLDQVEGQVFPIFYRDRDQDGYGDPGEALSAAASPAGYVGNDDDCDDGDAFAYPGQSWFMDEDNDGYSSGVQCAVSCLRPVGCKSAAELLTVNGDANDRDKGVVPPAVRQLKVILDGGGEGHVSSQPAGIDCGKSCSAGYLFNSEVVLTAYPSRGAVFAGWQWPGCSMEERCTVRLDKSSDVTVIFEPDDFPWSTFVPVIIQGRK